MKELNSFQRVHVDFDSEEAKEWSHLYPPEGLPTFIIIGADGKLRSKVNGILNEESFVKFLKYYKENDKLFESDSPDFSQIKNADVLREVLAKRWPYMDSPGPFASADEKTEFYRKLRSADFSFDTEIYLRDKATIQYLIVNSRMNHTLSPSEQEELISWFNSFLNDSSRVKAQVWELSELFSIMFNLAGWQNPLHSPVSKLKSYALDKDSDLSNLERLLLIKTYAEHISPDTSRVENDLLRFLLTYDPISSEQGEIFNKILTETLIALKLNIRAIDFAEKSIKYGGNSPVFLDLKGQANEKLGNTEQALSNYMDAALSEKQKDLLLFRGAIVIERFASNNITPDDNRVAFIVKMISLLLKDSATQDLDKSDNIFEKISKLKNHKDWFRQISLYSQQRKDLDSGIADIIKDKCFTYEHEYPLHVCPTKRAGSDSQVLIEFLTGDGWFVSESMPNGIKGINFSFHYQGKEIPFRTIAKTPESYKVSHGETLQGYSGHFGFLLAPMLSDVESGKAVVLTVQWYACNEGCRTKKEQFHLEIDKREFNNSLKLNVIGPDYSGIFPDTRPVLSETSDSASKDIVVSSLFYMAILAILGGLFLNCMPCVLPALSLKAGSLIKLREQSEKTIVRRCLSYSLGIVACFNFLALLFSALKMIGEEIGWGMHFQSPVFVYLLLVTVFFLVLSYFELFFIPVHWTSHVNTESRFYRGEFFNGVLTTVLASPCTGPLIGTVVSYSMAGQNITRFVIFNSIALGLASPILLIGVFPKTVRFLPNPGNWMNDLRIFLAVAMLITCCWLIWICFSLTSSVNVLLILISLVIIFIAVYTRSKQQSFKVYAISATLLTGLCVFRLVANDLSSDLVWKNFEPTLLSRLQNEKKVVFVYFTADWCLTCKWNEQHVIKSDDFKKIVDEHGIELVKGDLTTKNIDADSFMKLNGRSGVPAYFLINQRGAVVNLPEMISVEDVRKHL
ncbi:MAG: thioredoxin family protein [Deltaproteobacteria bacterium]|nr:thioredoxin family protein [Deltaproteobacteria bacterium]